MHCVFSTPGGTVTGPNVTVYDPGGVTPGPPDVPPPPAPLVPPPPDPLVPRVPLPRPVEGAVAPEHAKKRSARHPATTAFGIARGIPRSSAHASLIADAPCARM